MAIGPHQQCAVFRCRVFQISHAYMMNKWSLSSPHLARKLCNIRTVTHSNVNACLSVSMRSEDQRWKWSGLQNFRTLRERAEADHKTLCWNCPFWFQQGSNIQKSRLQMEKDKFKTCTGGDPLRKSLQKQKDTPAAKTIQMHQVLASSSFCAQSPARSQNLSRARSMFS